MCREGRADAQLLGHFGHGFADVHQAHGLGFEFGVYRFLVTVVIVAYFLIPWSRIFAHLSLPQQFVKSTPFNIRLSLHDARVLACGHGTPTPGLNFGPRALRENWPREPAKIYPQIVQATQVVVGRVSTGMHDRKKDHCWSWRCSS